MEVLIVAVGSRGDVAPFTGLGVALRDAGHSVTIATYRVFADLVTASGLEFRALPGDPRMQGFSAHGQRWQQGGAPGPLGVARFIRLAAGHMRDVHAGILTAARRGTDVMLVSGLGLLGGYCVAGGLGIPSIGLAVQPIHPAGQFPPPAVTTHSLGRWGNRAAGHAVLTLGAVFLDRSSTKLWADQGLPVARGREMFRRQDATHWPVFTGSALPWSRALQTGALAWRSPVTGGQRAGQAGRRRQIWRTSSMLGRRRCSSGSAAGTRRRRPPQ